MWLNFEKTRTSLCFRVNIVAADRLVTQEAIATVVSVLAYFAQIIPVAAPEGLIRKSATTTHPAFPTKPFK